MVHHSQKTSPKLLIASLSIALAVSGGSCAFWPFSRSSDTTEEKSDYQGPYYDDDTGNEIHSAVDPNSAPIDLVAQNPHLVPKPLELSTATPGVAVVRDQAAEVQAWCKELRGQVARFKWKIDPCPAEVKWKVGGLSVLGRSLVYAEFGDAAAENSTLVITMVHSDEVTPLYLGLKLAAWLSQAEQKDLLQGHRVVIAPLVNPDGLYKKVRTRQNSRGVDLNRNFATRDWNPQALIDWKRKYRSDRRRFPGHTPESEPETVFQRELIKLSHPTKILSVHAPLSMMDYDGPDTGLPLAKFLSDYGKEYLKLKTQLKTLSWRFYPGSLGNFAGRELGIPTMTLELPTADPGRAEGYWKVFEEGARTMVQFKVSDVSSFQGHHAAHP